MRYFKLLIDDSNDNDVVGHCDKNYGYEQW